jgi:hypothetical protein
MADLTFTEDRDDGFYQPTPDGPVHLVLDGQDRGPVPPGALKALDELRAIMDEAQRRPPHVCEEGCHCRAAYRQAIAEALGTPDPS